MIVVENFQTGLALLVDVPRDKNLTGNTFFFPFLLGFLLLFNFAFVRLICIWLALILNFFDQVIFRKISAKINVLGLKFEFI